ncbi:Bug family tripartite tricarboxylate transporter substrate binding protein [Ottowia thiooxydans]|uniref:Bug family tripartite tricarboxylate transporter substrate binding protein n=1 Tax=Ottowia thiooxydans TaxID=219182 RepID=UPI000418300D|nr:tripartite tricarboxylate transporter substrate binding protein [Ottowia thiooxydans]
MTTRWISKRRNTLMLGALVASQLLLSSAAFAQAFPSRPIRVVVPFAPGGVVDVTARILTQKMTERLGWNFIVDNKPGGNGFIAVSYVAKAPADGYTLLTAHTGEFAVNPAIFPSVPYDLDRDFAPITMISDTPMLLVANAKEPYNTIQELVAAEKKDPGKLAFSSPGNGSVNHLAGEWFSLEAGAKLLHVPYKGGAPAVAAVASGEVPLGVVAVPAVMPHVQSGRVKVLGLTTARRTPYNNAWMTANEAGVKNVDASNWVGLFAPKGVPSDVMAKLHAEVAKTLQDPDVKKRFADAGAEVGGMPSAEFADRIRKDVARYRDVAKKVNIKLE